MNQLVEDLRNENFEEEESYFDLSDCIHRAFNIILGPAKDKNVQLIGDVDYSCHIVIIKTLQGDAGRFV